MNENTSCFESLDRAGPWEINLIWELFPFSVIICRVVRTNCIAHTIPNRHLKTRRFFPNFHLKKDGDTQSWNHLRYDYMEWKKCRYFIRNERNKSNEWKIQVN